MATNEYHSLLAVGGRPEKEHKIEYSDVLSERSYWNKQQHGPLDEQSAER